MLSLNFSGTTKVFDPPSPLLSSISSSFSARDRYLFRASFAGGGRENLRFNCGTVMVFAMSGNPSSSKMNLNEYMVTLEKPFGIRFALTSDGRIIVYSLKKGGNAEKSRMILVGDTLKKAGDYSSQRTLVEIKDFEDIQKVINEQTTSLSLVLERPASPFPVQLLYKMNDGRSAIATWNNALLASSLWPSSDSSGKPGVLTFNSKTLTSKGYALLRYQEKHFVSRHENCFIESMTELDWAYGDFPIEEYIWAMDRTEGDCLYYNHSLGMRYTKITEQIYVGSCIQTEADVETLSRVEGITAVMSFQSRIEAEHWGIDIRSIIHSCQRNNILVVECPIRLGDSFDMRKKSPFCAGLLLRLLRTNYRVLLTCTSGFDRSPTCLIAYLYWMRGLPLDEAYKLVTRMHACRPDRSAIAWGTWDLIAMAEKGKHDGPPRHAVTFVWYENNKKNKNVTLVGDFTGNWKQPLPLKAIPDEDGPRYELVVKLPQGKYHYKFIVNGKWRHSTNSPLEIDDLGNLNNVIVIGGTASVWPSVQPQQKDTTRVKVIERPLDEKEACLLDKAASCIAFSVNPITFYPKPK